MVARPNRADTQVRPYGLLSHRAPFLCDVRFKFAAKFAYECARRPGGGITEGADRVARDVARDVENQIQVAVQTLLTTVELDLPLFIGQLHNAVQERDNRAAVPRGDEIELCAEDRSRSLRRAKFGFGGFVAAEEVTRRRI